MKLTWQLVPMTLLALLTGSAFTIATAQYGACTQDIGKFCNAIQPGDGRLASCLGEDHLDHISEACQQRLKQIFLQTQQIAEEPCQTPTQRLCFDAVLAGTDLIQCVQHHKAKLPAQCRTGR